MKEIREIKMVEQVNVKFIADDGKEFVGDTAERDCKIHERTLTADAAKAELARLNIKHAEMPFGTWCSSGYDLYFAHFENENEYFLFKSCIDKIEKIYDDCTELPKEFPYDVIYSLSEGYICEMSQDTFDKHMGKMRKLLAMILEMEEK